MKEAIHPLLSGSGFLAAKLNKYLLRMKVSGYVRFAIPILSLLLFSMGYAVSPQINLLLQSYNVNSSLINALQQQNITYANANYAALYNNGRLYFVYDYNTGSFLTNSTQIFFIIKNYTLANSLKLANFSSLALLVQRYAATSAAPLTDCLVETGLSRGLTCTLSNYCQSCQEVPSCNMAMYKTDGPSGPLGLGIMKFESQYNWLNSSYNNLYANINSINISNAQYKLSAINAELANISNLTSTIYMNPIFPPTANITNAQLSTCIYYSNPATAPWYCTALGYCQFTSYNYSMLNQIMARSFYINSLPITDAQIMGIAQNASNYTNSVIVPVLNAQKFALLGRILNTTLANYTATYGTALLLLSHISNSSLLNAVRAINSSYTYTLANYLSMNLSAENKTLANEFSTLKSLVGSLNSTYSYMLGYARNNTALLLKAQLSTQSPNPKLAQMGIEQLAINNELLGRISNTTALMGRMAGIRAYAAPLASAGFSLTSLVRAIDAPFARSVAYSLNMPYATAVAAMPALAALLSLLIGMVFILLIAFFYARLKLKRRLRLSRRVRRNWHLLFAMAGAIVIIYVAATYAFAANANSFATPSAFDNALKGSQHVAIVINGTPSLSIYQCASIISKSLIAMHKEPNIVSLVGKTCTVGNLTTTANYCLNYYSVRNIPIIELTNSSMASIGIYSFYGSRMSIAGNSTFMNACYPALLLS
ncbi:MAG: hypothetical protein QW778_04295 [Candidatus Micrarchaeaceae archaeon]